jgi:hypothetical protein
MSSSNQGSFSTFLLSLPLAGVAFMAMFGVPQFAPVMAHNNDEELVRGDRRRGERGSRDEEDVFSDFDQASPFENAPQFGSARSSEQASEGGMASGWATQPAADPGRHEYGRQQVVQAPQSTQQFQQQPLATPEWARGAEQAPAVESRNTLQGTQATSSTRELLDWHAASRKLNEIGIEKYHLEPGEEEGSFLFVCLFTPASSPNVTRRFEAEARDPLHAVNAVLAQIDDWLKQQYAQPAANSYRTTSL